jgi:hypothetical protein
MKDKIFILEASQLLISIRMKTKKLILNLSETSQILINLPQINHTVLQAINNLRIQFKEKKKGEKPTVINKAVL